MTRSSRCKVCQSAYTEFYERKHEEGFTYKELEELGKEMGDDFSFASMSRHIKNHYEPDKSDFKKSAIAKKYAELEIDSDIDELEEILENLKIARSLTARLIAELDAAEEMESDKINALKGLLQETRQSIKLAYDLSNKLDEQAQTIGKEDIIHAFMKVMNRLGVEKEERDRIPIILEEEL